MEDAKRNILDRVSRGELSAQEAALELQEISGGPTRAAAGVASPAGNPLGRVRVVHRMGTVTVLGDPSVAEAVAEGPHTARREGDVLVIESEDTDRGFTFGGGRVRISVDDRGLVVRMNPQLGLEVDINAGTLRVGGVLGAISGELHAGSAVIDGFRAPLNLAIQAGSLKAGGVLVGGASRVHCAAGSVKIHLGTGSDVRIAARTSLGRISLPDVGHRAGVGALRRDCVLGAGTGSLDIESEMGSVTVTADR